ncbi:MAG: prenyltransferase/squalene oxidase repeat-containing protein [Verrucomicrobiota bacterium]
MNPTTTSSAPPKADSIAVTLANATDSLLSERNDKGYWEGHLSSSALSTATAIIALHFVDHQQHRSLINKGIQWLITNQNDDGGWGDTTISYSNISTTLLCWSALAFAPNPSDAQNATTQAESWIKDDVGSLRPGEIAEAVKARYGKDRTFSVPILMTCALAGKLGQSPIENWRRVLPLPFELATVPRSWFGAIGLPVVSYALPALIAIGYARFHHAPPPPPVRLARKLAWNKASTLLAKIQPSTGGFLEATPLTSFVTMALAGADQSNHPVIARAVEFLTRSARTDGSWPIDTNLSTWTTTLAVKALGSTEKVDREILSNYLISSQYSEIHPYTNAPPGGWAWTELAGGVPDADDTPGALLALSILNKPSPDSHSLAAAQNAATWLLDLQNRDGGIPTFCRGWGKLPFDRSSPDLTAHTLRAWHTWHAHLPTTIQNRIDSGTAAALRYLEATRKPDGSWLPLWFGNQHRQDEANPTYGTATVLNALASLPKNQIGDLDASAVQWLLDNQNADGGWGGGSNSPSSIEETALALEALSKAALADPSLALAPLQKGADFLASATSQGTRFPPAPIGFYFAKLWYHEKLYPVIWTVAALNAFTALQNHRDSEDESASS